MYGVSNCCLFVVVVGSLELTIALGGRDLPTWWRKMEYMKIERRRMSKRLSLCSFKVSIVGYCLGVGGCDDVDDVDDVAISLELSA